MSLPLPASRLGRIASLISDKKVRVEMMYPRSQMETENRRGETEKVGDTFVIHIAPDKYGSNDRELEVYVHELGHVVNWESDESNGATHEQREANASAWASHFYAQTDLVAYSGESAIARLELEGEARVRQRRAVAFGRGDGTSFQSKPTPIKKGLVIKSLGSGRAGGYCVRWGSPNDRDLVGEYFTKETRELDSIWKVVKRLPYLYHHSLTSEIGATPIGVVDKLQIDDLGVFYEAELEKSNRYHAVVERLIREGKLGTSSQTFGVAKEVAADGRITRWPLVELSATTSPAESRMSPIAVLKSAYAEMGVRNFDEVLSGLGIDPDAEYRPRKSHLTLDSAPTASAADRAFMKEMFDRKDRGV